MKRPVFVAAACAALLLAGVGAGSISNAAAPAAAPTPVPRSAPNFAPMHFLLGTWTCRQIVRGKLRTDTGTTTVSLDGAYMMTHDVAPPFDKYRTKDVVTDSYLTYNPVNKMWVTVSVDNFGGYNVGMSPGWNGNTMATTAKLTQDGSTGSDVLTKVSDTKTVDVSVSTNPQGHVTHNKSTCTKAG